MCAVLTLIMAFCFNFDVPAQTTNPDDVDENKLENEKVSAKPVSKVSF